MSRWHITYADLADGTSGRPSRATRAALPAPVAPAALPDADEAAGDAVAAGPRALADATVGVEMEERVEPAEEVAVAEERAVEAEEVAVAEEGAVEAEVELSRKRDITECWEEMHDEQWERSVEHCMRQLSYDGMQANEKRGHVDDDWTSFKLWNS